MPDERAAANRRPVDPAASRLDRSQAHRATLVGGIALSLWASLPLLGSFATRLPPFELLAIAFGVAYLLSRVVRRLRGGPGPFAGLSIPLRAWLIGVGGLFGYHFFYFLAIRYAPVAEASLINHLWPLLIVLFSALLPGERLRWWHVAGAALGLAGTMLLVTDGGRVAFRAEYALGYGLALLCALTWSGYSVLNRRFAAEVPSDAVGAFCGVTAALAIAGHFLLEQPVTPDLGETLILVALGLGPLGIAFYCWDHATKRGDLRILGGAAYLTPLLATALLVAVGRAEPTLALVAACLLIAGGAALASREMLLRRHRIG